MVTPPPVRSDVAIVHARRVEGWVALAGSIKAKTITARELFQLGALAVGPAIVGERLITVKIAGKDELRLDPNIGGRETVPSNLSEAADILSQAGKDNFPYLFQNRRRVFDAEYYPEAIRVNSFHYNLPFFFSLRFSMARADWYKLVEKIGSRNRNPELGAVLANISEEIAAVESDLLRTHPLLQTKPVAPAQPGTGGSSRSASSSRPPVPPSSPGASRQGPPPIPVNPDPNEAPTVGKRRR
jgi:hypothetical protein